MTLSHVYGYCWGLEEKDQVVSTTSLFNIIRGRISGQPEVLNYPGQVFFQKLYFFSQFQLKAKICAANRHSQGEYARDEDGDGFYEVH